jgi:NADH dehydrogenase [ubiquinone] 1 alpha subcomplex assembly factor 5
MRQRRGDRRLAAIFELERDLPRSRAVSDGSAKLIEIGRRSKASAAQGILATVVVERQPAPNAAGIAEKVDRSPAIEAETVFLADDRPTGGTTQRQREIHDGAGDTPNERVQMHARLVPQCRDLHKSRMEADGPFDRRVRRIRRDRAAARAAAEPLGALMADELIERLGSINRSFADALILGGEPRLAAELRSLGMDVVVADPGFGFAAASGGIQCDEDRLPFGDGRFDLVVSVGLLDSINDLPGALALIRRTLRPDGLLLAAFSGAGSLPRLRAAMLAADEATGGAAPRIHPQIDVRAAGDLLSRAGFALPVADVQQLSLRYAHLPALVADLRAAGVTNILGARSRRPIGRRALAAAIASFADQADADGRTTERLEIITLTAWAPAPSQPQPARRGSGTRSLASVLRPREPD